MKPTINTFTLTVKHTDTPPSIAEHDSIEPAIDPDDDIFEKIDLDKFSQEINEKRNKMRMPLIRPFDPHLPLDLNEIMLSEDQPPENHHIPAPVQSRSISRKTPGQSRQFIQNRKKRELSPKTSNAKKSKKSETIPIDEIVNPTPTPPNPVLEENLQKILDFFGSKSYQRGWQYYTDQRVFGMKIQTLEDPNSIEITSKCFGSKLEPYELKILFKNKNIVSCECTCPVGSKCKHGSASLLLYFNTNQWTTLGDEMKELQTKHDLLWSDYMYLFEMYYRERQKVIQTAWVKNTFFDVFE
jgi:hypothetical protein